jgi:hypothetical protein
VGFLPFLRLRFRFFFGLGTTVFVVVAGVVMGVVVVVVLVVAVKAEVVVLVVVLVVEGLVLVLVAPVRVWLSVSCFVAMELSGGAMSSQCFAQALRHFARAISCSKVAVSGASRWPYRPFL